jgi:hypothetical protein
MGDKGSLPPHNLTVRLADKRTSQIQQNSQASRGEYPRQSVAQVIPAIQHFNYFL